MCAENGWKASATKAINNSIKTQFVAHKVN